jgi:hypothetical protein
MPEPNDRKPKPRDFAALLRSKVEQDPHKAEVARQKAGLSKQHWQDILSGTSPDSTRTAKICIALGIEKEFFDLFREEPRDVRKELVRVLVDLGVGSHSRLEPILEALFTEIDGLQAVEARELFLNCLAPFSSELFLGGAWTRAEVKGLREATAEGMSRLAQFVDKPPRSAPNEAVRALLAQVVKTALEGQNSGANDKVTLKGREYAAPSIPLMTSTLGAVHRDLLKVLALGKPERGSWFVFGVTTLLPSFWLNAPSHNNRRMHVGSAHSVVHDYRREVEALIASTSDVEYHRLSLSTDCDDLLKFGLVSNESALDQSHLYRLVTDQSGHPDWDTPVGQTSRNEAMRLLKERQNQSSESLDEWFRLQGPSHLLLTRGELGISHLPTEEAINVGSGWVCTSLVDWYAQTLHSDPRFARHAALTTSEPMVPCLGESAHGLPVVPVLTYLESLHPAPFELILIGSKEGEAIDWHLGLTGEAHWTTRGSVLRPITSPEVLQFLGDHWLGVYRSPNSRAWTEIARIQKP